MNRSLVTIVCLVGVSSAAMADDLTPPSWRFSAGSTVQHWDFSSGPVGGAPDALPLNNPFGLPFMVPAAGAAWQATFNGRNDVWNLSGQSALNFDIPNAGVTTHQKELWLQVTYFAPAPSPGPGYSVASASTGPFTLIGSQVTALPNGWTHELTKWSAPVCPQSERVAIFPTLVGTVVFVDQVVIDTLCYPVPSPGAASVLALSGLCAFRRRR